nr:zinc finger protein 729 [Hymenolepis microstoma]CDS32775.1 zinc finger protein 729 [Hymenolepis microstoma]
MTFSRPSHLARHLRVHLRDKPFACQYGRKCFPTKSSHTSYQRLHIGEKPFMCQTSLTTTNANILMLLLSTLSYIFNYYKSQSQYYTITITTYHATSTITNDTTVDTSSPRISTVPHRLLGTHRLLPHFKPEFYPSSIFTSSFSPTTYHNPTTIIINPPCTSHQSNYMLTTTNSTSLHMYALSSDCKIVALRWQVNNECFVFQ